MLMSNTSLLNVTNEEIGSNAENPERKLKLTSYKADSRNEGRHRVVLDVRLDVGDRCFQFVDTDAYEEAKDLFSLSNEIIPCFWSPKVFSHLPTILSPMVLTKLVELMKEHGNTWSVAHMCVSLPLPEETMMILLASDSFKEHFASTHHPKKYRILHLAIEQKSVIACRAIMRCSEHWLEEDPGLFVEDIDHKLPIQKATEIGAQECVEYLMQGQLGHGLKTEGIFGYFKADVLQLFQYALETKNCNKTRELLQKYPTLTRANFVDGNTGLHKAKDAKVSMLCMSRDGGWLGSVGLFKWPLHYKYGI